MAERRYSISQAGRLVGVENHVLRYWEDELHLEIPRDRKNQRYYTKLHIEMFQKINELKEKGYQLKAIEPVLKRMLAGEQELDLNEVLRQNAAEILRQTSIGAAQLEPETVYRYAAETGQDMAAPDSMNEESVESNMDGEAKTEVAARMEEEPAVMSHQEKLDQFQQLMNHIIGNAIGQAMRQNNEALSEEISRQVNDRMVQELEDMMRIKSGSKRWMSCCGPIRRKIRERQRRQRQECRFSGKRDSDGVGRSYNKKRVETIARSHTLFSIAFPLFIYQPGSH